MDLLCTIATPDASNSCKPKNRLFCSHLGKDRDTNKLTKLIQRVKHGDMRLIRVSRVGGW